MSRTPKVLVIGAGTGGLCLAHGIQAGGIDVHIYERDRTPTDRLQGYRLNISASGNRALASCLPKANYDRFVAASAKSSTAVSFFDQNLKRLLRIDLPPVDRDSIESERPVSRIALRRVLLDGIEERVAFGKIFQSFEDGDAGQVVARFEDGSTASGDVLVGADGAGSRVARQLLPQAQRIDTGVVVISGRFPLDAAARRETPAAVLCGPTLIMGPPGRFMFASAVEYPPEAVTIQDRDEYVMWGVSARRQDLGVQGALDELGAESARALALRQMAGWAPALRRMVERADPAFMSCFAVKSAAPVEPWPTRNVTLLGDALHNMTPYRGMGANMALRDAEALRDALMAVSQGEADLVPTLAAYERAMIKYGFAAVRASLANMERLHARSAIARLTTKTLFRLVDAIPSLQSAFRGER
jgi:2-polyprenyl-6-methoxyphenol hydroxylase-like FAD-dependent oxidoreductase